MSQCRLLYRRDAAGPVTYLVECEGQFYLCARGELGTVLSAARVDEIAKTRHGRWVQVTGEIQVSPPSHGQPRNLEMPPPASAGSAGAEYSAGA